MSEDLNNKTKEAEIAKEEIIEDSKVEDVVLEVEEDVVEELVEELEIPKIKEAPAVSPNVIATPKPVASDKPGLGYLENGVMGSTTVPKNFDKKPSKSPSLKKESEKVAVHSTKNVTWSEVGKVYRGYNIVTKEQADKWLTRDHIRLATPEEVAKEFKN
jgi:uncharacterized protein (UPF0147 family)